MTAPRRCGHCRIETTDWVMDVSDTADGEHIEEVLCREPDPCQHRYADAQAAELAAAEHPS